MTDGAPPLPGDRYSCSIQKPTEVIAVGRNKTFFLLTVLVVLLAMAGCDSTPRAVAGDEHDHAAEETAATAQAGHGDEEGDGGHGEEEGHGEVVRLSDKEMREFGIELARAGSGWLDNFVELPGEIVINSDTMVHIVPPVSGIVRKVNKKLGDPVVAGEVLAELSSRELAELKVAYLSARERYNLARELFTREEALWKKQIVAEQDYLAARKALAEARIELRSSEQKLHSLGFSEEDLALQDDHPDVTFTRYKVTAPFSGTVIEKHITLGEMVKSDSEIFVIANLDTVWVDISIYQKDLPLIEKGQTVVIGAGHGLPPGRGIISYVGPIVGETTRTAPARIVLDNSAGRWRPGMFITAKIAVSREEVPLLVPRTALQTFEEKQVIFVLDEDGFEHRPVVGARSIPMFLSTLGAADGRGTV